MADHAVPDAVPVERRTETGDAARQPSWSSSSSRGLAAACHSPAADSPGNDDCREPPAPIVPCRSGHLRPVTFGLVIDPRFGDVPPRSEFKSPLGHQNRCDFPKTCCTGTYTVRERSLSAWWISLRPGWAARTSRSRAGPGRAEPQARVRVREYVSGLVAGLEGAAGVRS